VVDGGYFLYII